MTNQRTPEWLEARRDSITSTDIPVLLGLSPWKSEAALAREKLGQPDPETSDPKRDRMMRLGLALEDVIRDEEELEHGFRLRHVNLLRTHPTIPWAKTSLDFVRSGQRTIVEAKASRSREWDDGLPQMVESQVRWQMGVTGYGRAHVAALRHGSELVCYDIEHDEALFEGLLVLARDFRRRLAEGGPFEENAASVRARYPSDSGTEIVADADVAEAVDALLAVRSQIASLEASEDKLKVAIQTRMGEASTMVGPTWRVLWRKTKDRTEVDWPRIADEYLNQLPEMERETLIGRHSTVRTGMRPFRVVKGDD